METGLKIEGMHCEGCARAVRNVLAAVGGVNSVMVDLDKGRASVSTNESVDHNALVAAVEGAGYKASLPG